MSIPDYQALMLPVLRYSANGPVRMPAIADQIADDLNLTQEDRQEMLPSGRQLLFYNRLAWAKFHMNKAGLIETPSRGQFVASKRGLELLNKSPTSIGVDMLRTYPDYSTFIDKASEAKTNDVVAANSAATSSSTPEEQIDAGYVVLHSALKAEILQRVLTQSPAFFERVIVDLLVAMGYGGTHDRAALRLGKSGDGGIDGVIDEDRLGLDRIYVQAKRYATHVSVGRPEIQGFVGSLVGLGATKGVFVTTSSFSSHAVDYVRHLPQRVILMDGERFAELMVEHDVGVRVSRSISVKRLDEDFFEGE